MISLASHALNLAVMPVRYQDGKVSVNGAYCSGKESLNNMQCSIIKKDGSTVHVIKNASVLNGGQRKLIGAVETLTDISEIISRDRQIEVFRRELYSQDTFTTA